MNVTIPTWNAQGVLPPINQAFPTSVDRSPYEVSLTDFVLRFSRISQERQSILDGFLSFRSDLHALGISQGFQWIDGSFLENIEMIESRAPNDVDVVTFFHLPDNQTQQRLFSVAPKLFTPFETKKKYRVDGYYVLLNSGSSEPLVSLATYWYSLWSHKRNEQWKGYLQIDLSPAEDQVAKANLDKIINGGGQP